MLYNNKAFSNIPLRDRKCPLQNDALPNAQTGSGTACHVNVTQFSSSAHSDTYYKDVTFRHPVRWTFRLSSAVTWLQFACNILELVWLDFIVVERAVDVFLHCCCLTLAAQVLWSRYWVCPTGLTEYRRRWRTAFSKVTIRNLKVNTDARCVEVAVCCGLWLLNYLPLTRHYVDVTICAYLYGIMTKNFIQLNDQAGAF